MNSRNFEIQESVSTSEMDIAFPLAEYKNRLNKIRNKMAQNNIDLLYVTLPESICYVSGYKNTWYAANSVKRWKNREVTGIAIHVDHDNFILFDMGDEEQLFLSNSVTTEYVPIVDQHVDIFDRSFVKAVEGVTISSIVAGELKRRGWTSGRTGIEMGSYRPSRLISQQLQAAFESAGSEVVDGTDIVHSVRKIKSAMELRCIEKATVIADIGHQAIRENLRAGMTELELCGEYTRAMYKAGGENQGIVDMVRFGPERVWCFHAPGTRRILMSGDPVAVDLCGVYNRYHSNQSRHYSFGKPDKKYADMYTINKIVMEKVRDIIKPNMLVKDFNKEIEEFYKKENWWGKGYWVGGYELGISFPPDWVGYYCYDPAEPLEDESERFEPGLVVNFETGFGVIDTLMFTETEAKVVGNSPWELVVID